MNQQPTFSREGETPIATDHLGVMILAARQNLIHPSVVCPSGVGRETSLARPGRRSVSKCVAFEWTDGEGRRRMRRRRRPREGESKLQNVTSLVSIEWEKLQQKKQQERRDSD